MEATLTAQVRTERGKGAARTMRREGRVPAVVYGHGEETRELALDTRETERLLSSISVENTLIQLTVGSEEPVRTLIREVQWHPFKPILLHVDLYQIRRGERIHLEIPVRLNGNPIGVRDEGGVLQHVRHDLEVACLPRAIPERIEVDVSQLSIGDSVHVRDIEIEGVEFLADPDLTICTVVAPTRIEEPEPEEGEELAEPTVVGAEEEEAEAADEETDRE